MEQSPSPSEDYGRDAKGRFGAGNKLAKGNPFALRVQKIRAALLSRLTVDDAKEIADVLIRQAKAGDLAAVRELLDRCLGKAPVAITGSDGGPIELAAIRDHREIFDVNGFAEHLRQFEAHQSDEAKRIAS